MRGTSAADAGAAAPPRSRRSRDVARTSPAARGQLPPTAQRLLDGARRVLERDGYTALTVDAIGREAGENKNLVAYYFGNKSGLLTVLMESILYEWLWAVRSSLLSPEATADPLATLKSTNVDFVHDTRAGALYWEVFPRLVEDPALAAHLVHWYRDIRELVARALAGSDAGDLPDDLRDLAALCVAVVDGLSAQVIAESGSLDVPRVFGLWWSMVEERLARYEAAAGDVEPAAPEA